MNVKKETLPTPKARMLRFLRDVVVVVLIAMLGSFLIRSFIAESFYIPSASMENTLKINDRILVSVLPQNISPVSRGDIIVFTDPGGWMGKDSTPEVDPFTKLITFSSHNNENSLVKRVIGLPGDHVTCCNAEGQISINGKAIVEPYVLLPPGKTRVSDVYFDVIVPEGQLFVLGDNRYNSKDSRYNPEAEYGGFVPYSKVLGKVFLKTWPVNSISLIDTYPQTFADVPAAVKEDQN